jgi:flagellar export protein FliJ
VKKFHFPLERVRQWREKQVAVEQARLEQLHGDRGAIEERIAALGKERAANDAAVVGGGTADALSLRSLDEYRRFARYRHAALERERAECDQRIAAQQAVIMEAQRKVRLLDKLKSRKHKLWSAAFDREIDAQAAEAFLAKWTSE